METIQGQTILVSKNDVHVSGNNLIIHYHDVDYVFAFKDISPLLAQASQSVREQFNVSPSGYGIHWPGVDEDLSIGALLKTKL